MNKFEKRIVKAFIKELKKKPKAAYGPLPTFLRNLANFAAEEAFEVEEEFRRPPFWLRALVDAFFWEDEQKELALIAEKRMASAKEWHVCINLLTFYNYY